LRVTAEALVRSLTTRVVLASIATPNYGSTTTSVSILGRPPTRSSGMSGATQCIIRAGAVKLLLAMRLPHGPTETPLWVQDQDGICGSAALLRRSFGSASALGAITPSLICAAPGTGIGLTTTEATILPTLLRAEILFRSSSFLARIRFTLLCLTMMSKAVIPNTKQAK
jgi:hypothetical protein